MPRLAHGRYSQRYSLGGSSDVVSGYQSPVAMDHGTPRHAVMQAIELKHSTLSTVMPLESAQHE